ncbi:MAG: hypothetical protein ABR968_11515, partial [Bacteroidales bacterium]
LYRQYGQVENSDVYNKLMIDKKKLNSKRAGLLRYMCRVLRIKLSEIKLLKLLCPTKYNKVNNNKLTSLFYVVGEVN